VGDVGRGQPMERVSRAADRRVSGATVGADLEQLMGVLIGN
jgi:hypothetical protein